LAVQFQKPDFVELLLKSGADVNIRNIYDSTLLHEALEGGDLVVAQLLISHGVDVNGLDCKRDSPLCLAVRFQKSDFVELLLRGGADVNIRNKYYSTTLHEAVESGSLETLKSLLTLGQGADVNAQALYHGTPLHLASLNGSLDMSRMLIEHGAYVNVQDNEGRTPFSVALTSGHRKLAQFLYSCQMTVYQSYA
jgi:ankyrin repeat protein